MSFSNQGISRTSWFWGIFLSLFLHVIIFLLVIFWGFGTPEYPSETESIEGRLVSASEFEQSIKGSAEPEKREEIKAPETEKTDVPKEPQKVEVKKEEPPPKVKEEKPKDKDAVALETRKEKKKQVAEIPKSTEQPKTKSPKETFEDVRNKVLAEMKKARNEENNEEKARQRVLGDLEKKKILKNIEKRMVEAGSSKEGGGTKGNSTEQSAGSRAVLASLFVNRVREEIRSNWGIPENIPMDGSLEAVIVFRVNENGKVYDVSVEKSSGNSAFDDFCVKAIYRASPLKTPPPPELLEEAKTDGVEVSFRNSPS
jgi:colicin import membrane protein